MRFARKVLALVVVAFASVGIAQQRSAPASSGLAFEVATIKPTARTDGAWHLQPTADGYTGMDVSLLKLVGEAYGIYDAKLISGGPPWIDRDKFDLEAKFDTSGIPAGKNLGFRERADMLQGLLADRFQLKMHRETREFPVYNLVVAKGGLKLKETKPEDVTTTVSGAACHFLLSRPGHILVKGCRIANLNDQLRFAAGRTVIDKTGDATRYDFELKWAPDNVPADSPAASAPSIFTALQEQLGLKLEPATAALSVLVIDSAEKPSGN